jgi:hypothetical protein
MHVWQEREQKIQAAVAESNEWRLGNAPDVTASDRTYDSAAAVKAAKATSDPTQPSESVRRTLHTTTPFSCAAEIQKRICGFSCG